MARLLLLTNHAKHRTPAITAVPSVGINRPGTDRWPVLMLAQTGRPEHMSRRRGGLAGRSAHPDGSGSSEVAASGPVRAEGWAFAERCTIMAGEQRRRAGGRAGEHARAVGAVRETGRMTGTPETSAAAVFARMSAYT